MSLIQTTDPPAAATSAECPVDHRTFGSKKSVRPSAVGGGAPLQQDARGGWQVRGFEEARAILRSPATRQAGVGGGAAAGRSAVSGSAMMKLHSFLSPALGQAVLTCAVSYDILYIISEGSVKGRMSCHRWTTGQMRI
jgi:hypothetical protein